MLTGLRTKKDKYSLPYETRVQALIAALEDCSLLDRVTVLPGDEDILSLDVSKYNGLVIGSNVLNNFNPSSKHKRKDRVFFSQFRRLVVLERKGVPIDEKVLAAARKQWSITLYPPESPISSNKIRLNYLGSKDITSLLPPAYEVLAPRLDLLRQGR